MNRTIVTVAGVFGASSLLLVDSAIKGTVLLVLASVSALILKRDSAATRHLVWLVAIAAMLVVPVLSAMLPQWRVLPVWMSSPRPVVVEVSPPSIAMSASGVIEAPQIAEPADVERPATSAIQPAVVRSDTRPALVMPGAVPTPTMWSWYWINALPLVWVIGFSVLMLRLSAARWMLWNSERRGIVIRRRVAPQLTFDSRSDSATVRCDHMTPTTDDPIVTALESVCSQLSISRPVTLLIHPDKTIPVVWGILRCRLLLPAAARDWSDEQLRSVLLHELAHIKRRDATAQLLTQIACALYWFNPLVWFAAWRLDVERERACDDLVLASGVRPSAYAGHLLAVVTGLSPARWTQSCGLAMARQSSLEGRLTAVLGKNLNRRGVSVALATVSLVTAAIIAVPIAMLGAADEKPTAPEQQGPQKPKQGTPLKPTTEQKLKWGEPASGLRMALAWPPTLGEPGMGDSPEFYLVVQNVSQAAIRLTANAAAPNPRRLIMRDNSSPLSAIADPTPMPGDWLLQPREVAFVRLYQPSEKSKDGHTTDAVIEQDIRVFPQFSMTAEMSIEKAPAGAWTGKLATGETRGSVDVIPPKHKDAQALYKSWTTAARTDGKIPGALIGKLGDSVKTFIKNNPTWETTPQLQKMLPRFEASRDWLGQDAVGLLDELSTAQSTPISMALDHENESVIRTGALLPPELANAPWGETLPNGLRHAWLLEPRVAEHRLGTPLKARVLIHNAGKTPVVFRTRSWHQLGHKATDAQGAEIKEESTFWTTIGRLTTFRLAPGEFIEVHGPGIGVGPVGNHEDWQQTRVGTWIEAKAGDEVTVTTNPLPLMDWNEEVPLKLDGEPRWWLDHIALRLSRHLPFPAGKDDRERLLYRIAMELFHTPVSQEINAAFVADNTPTALASLAERLVHRPGLHSWAGSLTSAPTKFRVLPADPDAAKKPRTANNPGHYTLSQKATLVVSRTGKDERIVNMAHLSLTGAESHKLNLPDGYGTWAAAWIRGGSVLWVQQKGLLLSIDFTNVAKVKETRFEGDQAAAAPIAADIREALRTVLAGPDAPKQVPEPRKPAPASAAPKKDANAAP